MKKIILLLIFATLLVGCSDTLPQSKEYREDDGTQVTVRNSGTTYVLQSLPRVIEYNDSSIVLNSIDFFQDEIEHGYLFYAVVTLDLSHLSEDDIYWMDKEKELELRISITNEANNYESESFCQITKFNRDNDRIFVFGFNEESRYSFNGSKYSLALYLKQGGTYEYKGENEKVTLLDKKDTYYLFSNPLNNEELKSLDTLDPDTYLFILKENDFK